MVYFLTYQRRSEAYNQNSDQQFGPKILSVEPYLLNPRVYFASGQAHQTALPRILSTPCSFLHTYIDTDIDKDQARIQLSKLI